MDIAPIETNHPETRRSTLCVAAAATALFTVCTIGPLYTIRLRMTPAVTGSLLDDPRLLLAFTAMHVVAIITGIWAWAQNPRLYRGTSPNGHSDPPRRLRLIFAISVMVGHALIALSALWSRVEGRSLTQATLFLLTTLSAAAVGKTISVRSLCTVLAVTHHAMIIVSLWSIKRDWPGTVDERGDWTGIFLNKNSFGPVAAVAILSVLGLLATFRREPIGGRLIAAYIAGSAAVVIDIAVLYRANSLTSVVGMVFAVVAAVYAPGAVRRAASGTRSASMRLGVWVAGCFVGAIGSVAIARSFAASVLGRSATLSGRTQLWGWLVPRIGDRPLGGWGWLSVWEEPDLKAQVVERFRIPFATAHNGLLEVAVGSGIPAALCFLTGAIAIMTLLTRYAATGLSATGQTRYEGVVALMLGAYVIAVNQLETFIGANLLPWALFVCVGTIAARELRRLGSDPGAETV